MFKYKPQTFTIHIQLEIIYVCMNTFPNERINIYDTIFTQYN